MIAWRDVNAMTISDQAKQMNMFFMQKNKGDSFDFRGLNYGKDVVDGWIMIFINKQPINALDVIPIN